MARVAGLRRRGSCRDAGRRGAAAGGAVAFHVLDIMESLLRSARRGRREIVGSSCDRPPLVPLQALPGTDETIPGYH